MNACTLEPLGDRALSLTFTDDAPLEANARVHRVASALRSTRIGGVSDLVPGMRSLVIHIDPLRCELPVVEALIEHVVAGEAGPADASLAPAPGSGAGDSCVELPVWYGGDHGPDLLSVAEATGLSADEVCRRHASATYVVCFVGFLPGFAYLGLLEPALRLPRRATPRPRVPAGAVAIAGEYTGVYPWASPGGWHLIGATDARLFDVAARPPSRLAPGMRVRFVPQERRAS